MKKNVKRNNFIFRNLILGGMIVLSVFFLTESVKEVVQTFTLRGQVKEALAKQEELSEKKEELEIEKKNLQNPEYLLRYARGKYLVTKDDGEQVFKLPEKKED